MLKEVQKLFAEKGIETEEYITYENHIPKKGLILKMSDTKAQPVVYPEGYQGTAEEFVEKVLEEHHLHEEGLKSLDVKLLTSYPFVKDKMMICLQRASQDESIMKKPFKYGMEAYIRVFLDESTSFKVKADMYKDINEHYIWATAYKNTLESVVISPLGNMVADLLDEDSFETKNMPETYVVTNKFRLHGAGSMVCSEVFEKIRAENSNKLVILPSSIHEFLVMADDNADIEKLTKMVKDINISCVEPKEQLCDEAFLSSNVIL